MSFQLPEPDLSAIKDLFIFNSSIDPTGLFGQVLIIMIISLFVGGMRTVAYRMTLLPVALIINIAFIKISWMIILPLALVYGTSIMNLKSISKLIEIATVSVKDMPEKAKEAVSAMKPDTTETGYTFLGKPTTYVSPNAPLTEQIEAFKEKTENWMTIKK